MKKLLPQISVILLSIFLLTSAFAQTDNPDRVKSDNEKNLTDFVPKEIVFPTDGNYCDAGGGCDEFIDGVEFGDISNLGTGCSGYHDYTALSTDVIPGFTYSLTVYTGNVYSSDDYAVWIDWNANEIFDSNEQMVCEINNGQLTHSWDIEVPVNATPGLTTMRIRLKWSGSDCGDPCGTTTYGEVEDYSVNVIPGTTGNLEGFVTELSSGDPIEGAVVDFDGLFTTTTASNGFYELTEVYTGDWEVTVTKEGYNITSAIVTILENQTTQQDFELTAPTMEIDPLVIDVTLDPFGSSTELITISNNGNGVLDWSAELEIISGENWIAINPEAGTVDPGMNETMAVDLDASELLAGNIVNALIHFMSDPAVGTETVNVTLVVGDLEVGTINGNVFLDGVAPYNIGDVTECLIEAGPYITYPNSSGDYSVTVYPGTYDVSVTLYGYTTQTETGIVVGEAATVNDIDFVMPCVIGRFYGLVTDNNSGAPIGNALVSALGTDMEVYTENDGSYEMFIEAGTYDLIAQHPTYVQGLAQNQVLGAQSDTEVNFSLEYQCNFCIASGGCDEYIDGVELGDIVNLGTGCGEYQDFTDLSTLIIPDFTYTLTIHTGNVYTSDDYGVWIDWNRDCEFDPVAEQVICESDIGAPVNTFEFTVPINATPGPAVMRVRLKYSGSTCGDPCGSTTWGEVEDYTVFIIPATTGDLEGYVTELSTGDPIENAQINVEGLFNTTTGSDGYYFIEDVYTGDWSVTCTHPSYNPKSAMVTILEDQLTTQDFDMTAPTIEVDPLSINVTLEYGQTTQETITIANNGNGPLNWSASYLVVGPNKNTKDYLDLHFEYPATGATSQIGIECDGNYFYTAKWSGGDFYKYALDGTFIESFTIPGAGFIRDMAYDGMHFYGSNESNIVYEMDFETQTLIGTFVAPTDVRAIAYNDDLGVFYANKGSSDIYIFDKAGNVYGNFSVGPAGGSYYGLAYDNSSEGGPFLWGYSTNGTNSNTLVKMELPSGDEVFTLDLTTKLNGTVTDIAGGLFTHPNLVAGKWTLGGLVQDEWIWGLELGDFEAWLDIEPGAGTLAPGNDITMTVNLDATDVFPGTHEAVINFTSSPAVGTPVVNVTMFVPGLVPPINLNAVINCMDIELTWQMPAGDPPDSWNVYRDDALIANVTEMQYTDPDMEPGTYIYYIKAVYDGEESIPSQAIEVDLEIPDLLPMANFAGMKEGNDVYLVWTESPTCLGALGYNIYRDGVKINEELITELEYWDMDLPNGSYDYYGTAEFEYGESSQTNTLTIGILVGMEEIRDQELAIFPNPVKENLSIVAKEMLKSIKLVDSRGMVVLDEEIRVKDHTINVSNFEKGIYIIEIETETDTYFRKIIVE